MTEALEVRLLRWGESSQSGRTVTFLLPEDGEHPFRGLRTGKDGAMFALAVAQIEDPKAKADHIFPSGYVDAPKEKSEGQTCVKMAHALCRDPKFQAWMCEPFGAREDMTRARMLTHCGIFSRADFAINPEACAKLRDMKFQFDHRETRR